MAASPKIGDPRNSLEERDKQISECPPASLGDDHISRGARSSTSGGGFWRRELHRLGVILIAAGTGWAIYAEWGTIRSGFGVIGHTRPWFLLAPAAEFIAMSAFVLLQRRLLHAVGAHLPLSWLWSTAHLANGIDLVVPFAGGAMATGYIHRRFRQRGVESVAATLVLTLAGIFATASLAGVMVLAAIESGNLAAASSAVAAAVIAVGGLISIVVALHTARGQLRLEKMTKWILLLLQRAVHRPHGDVGAISERAIARINSVHLNVATICESSAWATMNWIADAACLVFAIKATGASVPWHQVLLVWSAGMGAEAFSPTPGGIGAVEVTMITALVASGLHAPEAVAAVLLYRCVNAKVLVTTTLALRPLRMVFGHHRGPAK